MNIINLTGDYKEEKIEDKVLIDVLDCPACALKHVAKARVCYGEYLQNPDFRLEFALCIGNLGCAEDHLLTSRPDLANTCRTLRIMIMEHTLSDIQLFNDFLEIISEFSGLYSD